VSTPGATRPTHPQHPGTARERATAPAQHRAHQPGRQTKPPRAAAQREAQTWVLCTPTPTGAQAVADDAQRLASAATCRAWHSGWGGRAAVVDRPTAAMVDRLRGGVCLAASFQMHLGQRRSEDPRGQQRRGQWTVTARVRWFWWGPRLCNAPGDAWRTGLAAPWATLSLPHAPVVPEPGPVLVRDEAA